MKILSAALFLTLTACGTTPEEKEDAPKEKPHFEQLMDVKRVITKRHREFVSKHITNHQLPEYPQVIILKTPLTNRYLTNVSEVDGFLSDLPIPQNSFQAIGTGIIATYRARFLGWLKPETKAQWWAELNQAHNAYLHCIADMKDCYIKLDDTCVEIDLKYTKL